MKKTPLKRTGWARTSAKKATYKELTQVKVKLPKIKTVRTKADNLLTPIIKAMFPKCLLCGKPTEVAHHHVHKSKSTRLRYEIDNLVNLCHSCHQKLHHNESFWASKIVEIRGIEWFKRISKIGQEIVKADVHFYIGHYERLKRILNEL